MRIQFASDLYLPRIAKSHPGHPILPADGAQVLVLAGNIGPVDDVIELFKDWLVPVLYVLGPEEQGDEPLEQVSQRARLLSQGTQVHVLQNEAFVLEGVRFLGTALSRNPATPGAVAVPFPVASRHPQPVPSQASDLSAQDWLRANLAQPFNGKTVVITHSEPHLLQRNPSPHWAWTGASDMGALSTMVGQAHVWLHGNLHYSRRIDVGQCQVLTNPSGPVRPSSLGKTAPELVFENALFGRNRTLDI